MIILQSSLFTRIKKLVHQVIQFFYFYGKFSFLLAIFLKVKYDLDMFSMGFVIFNLL